MLQFWRFLLHCHLLRCHVVILSSRHQWLLSLVTLSSCDLHIIIISLSSCIDIIFFASTDNSIAFDGCDLCYWHSPPFSQALTSAVHVIVSIWMLLRAMMLKTSSARGRWPQDGLKMTLRGPKMPPTWPQDGSNMASRWPQDGSTFVTHFSASLISQRSTRWLLWSVLLPLTTFLASTHSSIACDCICHHLSIYGYVDPKMAPPLSLISPPA